LVRLPERGSPRGLQQPIDQGVDVRRVPRSDQPALAVKPAAAPDWALSCRRRPAVQVPRDAPGPPFFPLPGPNRGQHIDEKTKIRFTDFAPLRAPAALAARTLGQEPGYAEPLLNRRILLQPLATAREKRVRRDSVDQISLPYRKGVYPALLIGIGDRLPPSGTSTSAPRSAGHRLAAMCRSRAALAGRWPRS
jgi:hypothetical protein